MKKSFLLFFLVLCILLISGCKKNNNDYNQVDSKEKNMQEFKNNISITINNKVYNATLEDNETSGEFYKMLPLELKMNELNGNEKYFYLDKTLSTNSTNPKHINSGDIMLYGNDCLVIFYKSFSTNYSYTKIGHIDNLEDLGQDNIVVKFEEK